MTIENLAIRVTQGDHDAVLELLDQFEPMISKLTYTYGVHPTFDRDDARQECVLALYDAAQEVADGVTDSFTAAFHNRAREILRTRCAEHRCAVRLPLTTFRRINEAVKAHDGDVAAARRWLQHEAPPSQRVTGPTFDAIWFLAFGEVITWFEYTSDDGPGLMIADVQADPRSPSALSTVEDRLAVEQLLSGLTDRQREMVSRRFGLGDFEPQEYSVIAAAMGMKEGAVRTAVHRALVHIQQRNEPPETTRFRAPTYEEWSNRRALRPRSTHGGGRRVSPSKYPPFPVTVTRKDAA